MRARTWISESSMFDTFFRYTSLFVVYIYISPSLSVSLTPERAGSLKPVLAYLGLRRRRVRYAPREREERERRVESNNGLSLTLQEGNEVRDRFNLCWAVVLEAAIPLGGWVSTTACVPCRYIISPFGPQRRTKAKP